MEEPKKSLWRGIVGACFFCLLEWDGATLTGGELLDYCTTGQSPRRTLCAFMNP